LYRKREKLVNKENKIVAIIGTLSVALMGLMAIGKVHEKNKIAELALLEREKILIK
jgi:hypothetical protein